VKRAWIAAVALALGALADVRASAGPSRHEGFVVKLGVMDPVDLRENRFRETRTVTRDARRRPGWCFVVDPPSDAPYEVYSVHHLPGTTDRPPGRGRDAGAARDLETPARRVTGVQPFCFDFDERDPLGDYRIDVFIDRTLKARLELEVIAPNPDEPERKR